MSEKKSYLEGEKILAVDDEKDILEIIEEELDMADVDIALSFLPKEKLAELDRLLEMLLIANDSGKSTWKILFDELGNYFDERFGAPMGTIEWILRRTNK